MKRILCIILAVLLLTPAVFASGENMTFSLSQLEGKVGDTVTITGEVKGAPACTSFRVILTYDDTCLKITNGVISNKVKGGQPLNIDTTFNGKKAITALAVDVSKSFEGDVALFTLTAEIIGEPTTGNSSSIDIVHYEFFDANVKRITLDESALIAGSITYPTLVQTPDDNTGSTTPSNPDEGATTPDDNTDTTTPENNTGSTAPENNIGGTAPENNTGSAAPENNSNNNDTTGKDEPAKEEKDDKTPTGEWFVVGDQFAHIDEDGSTNLYEGEYEEPENPGDQAEVILKDEEGNEVGSVVIEKDEAGNLNVVEQDLNPKKPVWPWIVGGIALVLVAAAVTVVILLKKKKATV